jgi:hypothetical protein
MQKATSAGKSTNHQFTKKEPIVTPGHIPSPPRMRAAMAMPVGGHTKVMALESLTVAAASPSQAPTMYDKATTMIQKDRRQTP